jgi:hypothetical protein
MLIELEKAILNRDFIPCKNTNNIWSFHKKNDSLSQINLTFNNNIYKFSFPINEIHYSTTFKNKERLIKYINYILFSHKF